MSGYSHTAVIIMNFKALLVLMNDFYKRVPIFSSLCVTIGERRSGVPSAPVKRFSSQIWLFNKDRKAKLKNEVYWCWSIEIFVLSWQNRFDLLIFFLVPSTQKFGFHDFFRYVRCKVHKSALFADVRKCESRAVDMYKMK